MPSTRQPKRDRMDVYALFAALDAARMERNLRWWQVAEEAQVSQSTLTRLGQGRRPDIDGALALTHWLGLPLETFERDAQGEPTRQTPPLAEMVALLRADKTLTPDGREMLDRLIRSTYQQFKKK